MIQNLKIPTCTNYRMTFRSVARGRIVRNAREAGNPIEYAPAVEDIVARVDASKMWNFDFKILDFWNK